MVLLVGVFVYGHRGAAGEAAENTLAAVARGIAAGCDGIEVDLRLCDGVPVVLHDADLDRTTSATGSVYVRSRAELPGVTVADAPIPSLDDIDAACRGVRVNLECKDAAVVASVCAAWRPDRDWLLSSFLIPALERARVLAGDLPRALCSVEGWRGIDRAVRLGCVALHLPCALVDRALVAACHDRGLRVGAFTANDVATVDRLAGCGCDAVFTDHPRRIRTGHGS